MSDETKARIAEIEARERAATLGPWRDITDSIAAQVDADKSFGCTCTAIERAGVDGLGGEIVGIGWYDGPVLTLRTGDATFIAHARADVPWLLERLAAETKRADEAERERDERTESMEWWRTACVRWQDWGKALLAELGQQLRHGLYGSTPTREIIASLARAAPPVPHCLRCGHFSTRHEVDDEELRECLDCQCSQYEACT